MQSPFKHIRSFFLLLLMIVSANVHAQKKAPAVKKDTFQKKKAASTDTSFRADAATGDRYYKGKLLYSANNMPADRPGQRPNTPAELTEQALRKSLLTNMENELKTLPDNEYYFDIRNIVINELGHIAYSNNGGILTVEPLPDGSHKPANADVLRTRVALILNAVYCKPACINSIFVPYMLQDLTARQSFTIKDHKVINK